MAVFYNKREGWLVTCDECDDGRCYSHDRADYYGGYLAIQTTCDECGGTGYFEANSDDLDGHQVCAPNDVIGEWSLGYICDDQDNEHGPYDMVDMRPVIFQPERLAA